MTRLPDPEHALAVTSLDDRHACKERVLSSLEDIIKFETDPVFAKLAQRRFLDITDGEHHVQHRA